MLNGKYTKCLSSVHLEKGWTVKANLNSDFVINIKKWKKEAGIEISKALKENNGKKVIELMQLSFSYKKALSDAFRSPSRVVYDAYGNAIYSSEVEEEYVFHKLDVPFYFTFELGSGIPNYKDSYVIVRSENISAAICKFEKRFPNKENPEELGFSNYYNVEQWHTILTSGIYKKENLLEVVE